MAWLFMVETSCVRVFITLSKHWANNTISSISWILFSTTWWVVCYPTSMIESCIARTSLHAMRRDTSWYTLMQRQHKGRSENGCCDSELVSVGFFFSNFSVGLFAGLRRTRRLLDGVAQALNARMLVHTVVFSLFVRTHEELVLLSSWSPRSDAYTVFFVRFYYPIQLTTLATSTLIIISTSNTEK